MELQSVEYYTIMVDKTTNTSNKEQLITEFCYVDDELQAHEKFVGFYQLDTTDTKTIVTVLKNVILALNLDIHRHRGQ